MSDISKVFTWTQDIDKTYKRRSEDVLDFDFDTDVKNITFS